MAKLNIYKIDNNKIDEFTNLAAQKLKFKNTKNVVDHEGKEFRIVVVYVESTR